MCKQTSFETTRAWDENKLAPDNNPDFAQMITPETAKPCPIY